MVGSLKSQIDTEKQRLDDVFGDLCAAEIRTETLFKDCCLCAEKLQILLKEFEYQICKIQT